MSNYLAIATVTATLRELLQEAAVQAVPGADVTTQRPENAMAAGNNKAGINVFLYQVVTNPALNNASEPTRNVTGQFLRRPQVALNLHYLLSFQGADAELEPQRLLGSTVIALRTQPVLPRAAILRAVQTNAFLAQSDLADQIEAVRFTPFDLSLEELSKLWSVFFQVPYVLSIAYLASVALLEAEVTPIVVKPVLVRDITLSPEVPSA